jgi:hypothetical protein
MTLRGLAEKYTGRVQSDDVRLEPRPATFDANDGTVAAP